ncbi:TRAP transporter large permease subunit, partial [Hydrogenophaga sp.]|uniref:TRAP transporter large permease subunit n=1 Tax=Hydrogenophaga sp. TaxID=1904254 RepID=UPI0025C67E4C
VVNLLVFVLGMFIDFFEIAFIVIPLLAPVADKLGIDLIWFGVILAMNLQTSFLTPPFGFALFYLRSVAARSDYTDHVTKQRIPAVTTAQIYKGSIAFIILQLIMVVVIIAYPTLVTGSLGAKVEVDDAAVTDMLRNMRGMEEEEPAMPEPGSTEPAAEAGAPGAPAGLEPPPPEPEVDPGKALEESMKKTQ